MVTAMRFRVIHSVEIHLITIIGRVIGYIAIGRPTFNPIHFRPTSFRPKIFIQSISSNSNCPFAVPNQSMHGKYSLISV